MPLHAFYSVYIKRPIQRGSNTTASRTYTIAEKAVLTSYLATPNREVPRPAVIVLPGGGWIGTSPSEGECVALAYLAQGFQAFVLDYSKLKSNPGGCAYPQPLLELAESVRLIKAHADEWHIDPQRIIVWGLVGSRDVQPIWQKRGIGHAWAPTAH